MEGWSESYLRQHGLAGAGRSMQKHAARQPQQ